MDEIEVLNAALAGRYHIERTVGEGGMATVYLARDIKHERPVALKVLDSELGASLGAARFLTEIRTTAQLVHPHILPLYDSGDADGHLFFVMPFIEGETLRDLVDREDRLAVSDAIRLFAEVTDAVGFAHKRGIIHRDIKPENILLAGRHAFVADFGIARAISVSGDERLTRAGMTLGTPAYMSPEQASGSPRLDARTDIYSLGCLLFELISGDPPFTGATNQEVIAQRFQLEIGPSVSALRSGVPARVDAAIRKAMAREPMARFQTTEQFIAALTAESSPSGLRRATDLAPQSTVNRPAFAAPGAPNSAPTTATPAAPVGDTGAAAAAPPDRPRFAPPINPTGEAPRNRPPKQSLGHKLMRPGLFKTPAASTVDFGTTELLVRGRAMVATRAEGVQRGIDLLQEAAARTPDAPEVFAELASAYTTAALASTMLPLDAWSDARDSANHALTLDPKCARAYVELGNAALWYDWDWATARSHFDRGAALRPNDPLVQAALGTYWSSRSLHDDALWCCERAVSADPNGSAARTSLAVARFFARRFTESVTTCDQVIAVEPAFSEAHRWKALALRELGKTDDALNAAEAAMRLSGRHPWSMATRALVCASADRTDAARAIVDELAARDESHPMPHTGLAMVLLQLGDAAGCVERLQRAVAARDPWLVMLAADPRFDMVRQDAGFGAVVEGVGAPR